MKVLWTLFKVALALVLVIPLGIILLGTMLGIFGALLGLAIMALRVAVVGLVIYGAIKLISRLMRDPAPPPAPRELTSLPRADPYYESALRELDRDVGPIR
jgi:hypothetical protein